MDCTVDFIRAVLQKNVKKAHALADRIHWPRIDGLICANLLAGVIWYNLKHMKLLDAVPGAKTYESVALRHCARNIRLENMYHDIARTARSQGIPILPLKGLNVIHAVYPHPGMRVLQDIDVLCKPSDLERMTDVLVTRKFYWNRQGAGDAGSTRVFSLLDCAPEVHMICELHTAIVPPRPWPIVLDVWTRAYEQQGVCWMSPEDVFLTTLLKIRRDCRGLTLGMFQDLVLLADGKRSLDWDYIQRACAENRLMPVLRFSEQVLQYWFDSSLPLPPRRGYWSKTTGVWFLRLLKKWRVGYGYALRLLFFNSIAELLAYCYVKSADVLRRAAAERARRESLRTPEIANR